MKNIKRVIAMLALTYALALPGYCDSSEAASAGAEVHVLLNAYSALADEYFVSVIRELRLLASTGEVRSGEWETMARLLAELEKSGIAAAAVWYARPDGSYYTVDKGQTGESLADRPYFPNLFAGNEVAGELVISRSTGKRSAVFAVPVRSGDATTGALGVSLSMDEASGYLSGKLELPPEFVLYALDTKGRTSLHARPALVFEYPSDMGSETLNEAVRKMLSEDEGMVEYEFQGSKTVYFKRSPLTGWVYALGVITGPVPAGK